MAGHNHHKQNNILVAVALNVSFTIVEIIGGLLTNSVAILSDALHDAGDSIALISSYFAEKKATQGRDQKRTFGYARVSLFSAVLNAAVLLGGSVFILIEAVKRLYSPEPVVSLGMIGLAVFGVIVNYIGYRRLVGGESVNEGVLRWHLLEDVLGWSVLLVGSIIIYFTGWFVIDPIITVGYTLFILWGVAKSLQKAGNIFMQGVPTHIDIDEITGAVKEVGGVVDIHDVHIWSLDGEQDILTAHVVLTDEALQNGQKIREKIKAKLEGYHIEHSTIELEDKQSCSGIECKNKR